MKVLKRLIKKSYRYKENITIKEMLDIIKTNDNVILLDVRSKQEYNEAHLARKHKHSCLWFRKKCTKHVR